jgi:metalloproteinase inhibitor 2
MKKILVLLLLAAALVPATAGTSWACQCVPSKMQTFVDRADVVFAGTATHVSGDRRNSSVTFEVANGFKGDVPGEVIVSTPASSAACGVIFEPGQTYTVFATRNGSTIETNSCSGTEAGIMDLSRFGLTGQSDTGTEPASGAGDQATPQSERQVPALAIVVAIVIGVGLLTSVRRLRPRTPTTTTTSDSP